VFAEVVHFVYHGTVSLPLTRNLDAMLTLLVLAHRFSVTALADFCTQAASDITSNPSTFLPQQALQILSLPSLSTRCPASPPARFRPGPHPRNLRPLHQERGP